MRHASNQQQIRIEVGLHGPQSVVHHHPARFKVVDAGRRFGKALDIETSIATPNGWKSLGELCVGDEVFGSDGMPTRIVNVSPIYYDRPCYRLTFSDRSTLVADAEHEWLTFDKSARKNLARGLMRHGPKLHTTEEIANTLKVGGKSESNHSILLAPPLQMPKRNLPIEPYLLGLWLGDGDKYHGLIFSADVDIIDRILMMGYTEAKIDYDPIGRCSSVTVGNRNGDRRYNFQSRLRKLGLLCNKHIPKPYLQASESQRRELLAGLMDTDGCISDNGNCEYCSVNQRLANNVLDLALSLGIRAVLYTGDATLDGRFISKKWRVHFPITANPFVLPRKRDRANRVLDGKKRRNGPVDQVAMRYIEDVARIASVPVRCIQVEAADGLYLAGRALVPTHNSLLGTLETFEVGAQGKRAWWVAPSYKMTEVGWRPLRMMGQKVGAKVYKDDRVIEFQNGGLIAVRSADTPDSLRSEGLDYVVFDEAAYAKEEAWTEALRPALADRKGRAMFISTPDGRNWFWRLWMRAASGDDPDWFAWQFPTSANPFIDPSEIEAARRGLPERTFRQEFMAEFIDDAGAVFRNIRACATAEPQEAPLAGHTYLMGCDWGKTGDFTCFSILDVNLKAIVKLDRFNMIDYAIQRGRLLALAETFRPEVIIVERNSIGDPVAEELLRMGLPIQTFLTTSASKQLAVDALALALEKEEIHFINDPILTAELEAYESVKLPSGMLRYSAPSGSHDDCAMSVMMAWQGIASTVMDVHYANVRLR